VVREREVTLDELAIQHGTDKGSAHPRLAPKRYAEIYELLFHGLQVRSLLEFGVARGASIRMWAEYYPYATIVGLDVRRPPAIELDNVRLFRGSQSDPAVLGRIAEAHAPFDVVIDDGSHRATDQLLSFAWLWRHVRPGGYYAIEDLHAPDSCSGDDVKRLLNNDHGDVAVCCNRNLVVARKSSAA
jgi:demethylmacrocin O-methyltransferase